MGSQLSTVVGGLLIHGSACLTKHIDNLTYNKNPNKCNHFEIKDTKDYTSSFLTKDKTMYLKHSFHSTSCPSW